MRKYLVKISDEALADMQAIYDYIAYDLLEPDYALGQYNRIALSILSLDTFPERFGLFDSEPEHSFGIHRMIVDNYLICYIVDSESVTVISVLYGASDIHRKLNDRLSL